MGLFLLGPTLVGCVVGLLVAAIPANIGVAITVRRANSYNQAWRHFGLAYTVFLAILIAIIYNYPYSHVRPGNDFDIAMKVFFNSGRHILLSLALQY